MMLMNFCLPPPPPPPKAPFTFSAMPDPTPLTAALTGLSPCATFLIAVVAAVAVKPPPSALLCRLSVAPVSRSPTFLTASPPFAFA